jgi:hypothetical protein
MYHDEAAANLLRNHSARVVQAIQGVGRIELGM